jgi:hypothetical protein
MSELQCVARLKIHALLLGSGVFTDQQLNECTQHALPRLRTLCTNSKNPR